MSNVNVIINGQNIVAQSGQTVLEVARGNGIEIPTLCYIEDKLPKGGCRMCVVEIENMRTLPVACATKVSEGMVISTDSEEVRASRKATLELLLSRHAVDCLHCVRLGSSKSEDLDPMYCEMCFFCDCVRDGICTLQTLSREYKVNVLPYEIETYKHKEDQSSEAIIRNANKCISCRKCVEVCEETQAVNALGIFNRGVNTLIKPIGDCLASSACVSCGRCIDVCPTGAIYQKEHIDEVLVYAHSYDQTVVALLSEDIITRLAECNKVQNVEIEMNRIIGGLRKIGVSYVYAETDITALMQEDLFEQLSDKLACNEITLLATGFSSAKFIADHYPQLKANTVSMSIANKFHEFVYSKLKAEKGLNEKDIKTIYVTHTHENAREAVLNKTIDYVIDANELHRIFIRTGVNLKRVSQSEFDMLNTDLTSEIIFTKNEYGFNKPSSIKAITINGKSIDVLTCNSLGQAKEAIEHHCKQPLIIINA